MTYEETAKEEWTAINSHDNRTAKVEHHTILVESNEVATFLSFTKFKGRMDYDLKGAMAFCKEQPNTSVVSLSVSHERVSPADSSVFDPFYRINTKLKIKFENPELNRFPLVIECRIGGGSLPRFVFEDAPFRIWRGHRGDAIKDSLKWFYDVWSHPQSKSFYNYS